MTIWSQSTDEPVQRDIQGKLGWLTNSLHQCVEITVANEYTITVGMGLADNPSDAFVQIHDPVMSRLQRGKRHINYLYPHYDSNNCQVQARTVSEPEKLSDEQRQFLTLCLRSAECVVKGGVAILTVPLLETRFFLLISKLYPLIDPKKTGYYMSCHYFTILFRDNPKGLINIISSKADVNGPRKHLSPGAAA